MLATSWSEALRTQRAQGRIVKTCLVSGAAGFIGSHLCERLLREGYTVRGLDALTDYYNPDLKLANINEARSHVRFEWVEGDLNTVDFGALLDGVNIVFHLAGQPGVRGSWGQTFNPYVRNNVEATQRLLEASRSASIERFVYASSSSVYGCVATPMREDAVTRPHSPYGVTKLAGELLCLLYARNFGVPACAVRYFTVFGPRQRPDMAFARFFRAMRDDVAIGVFGDGSQTRDFTYVEDAVEGTRLAAERGVPGEVYNLGGGCRVSLNDAIAAIERACGRHARIERGPTENGDVVMTLADTEKAVTQLGYRPGVDLERGLWEHAKSFGLARTRHSRAVTAARKPRVLLYSHDTFGLGHLRRNLAIASDLLRGERPHDVALLSGSPVLATWPKPAGLRVIPLPPVVKVGAEAYRARDTSLSFEQVKAQREQVIRNTIVGFAPDVFLVDHSPAGMRGELLEALAYLRREMPTTSVVVGLRDIVDEPGAVRALWREQGVYSLLEWAYDRILVYGSQHLFDIAREYGFDSALADKVRYCGYVARTLPPASERAAHPFTVLVTTGGGGDGFPLVRDYLHASRDFGGNDVRSIVVLGPLMDHDERNHLENLARGRNNVTLVPYAVELLAVLRDANLVVAMGGYNTAAEIVANHKPAVLVPRTTPRQEQLVRSRILRDLGLVWLVEPNDVVVPTLRSYIGVALAGAVPEGLSRCDLDFAGASRAGDELDALVRDRPLVGMVVAS